MLGKEMCGCMYLYIYIWDLTYKDIASQLAMFMDRKVSGIS
jgi:hypothetical protein